MSDKTAYVILVVDSETKVAKGIGIFSEKCPTFGADLIFVVHKSIAESLQKAYEMCKEWCKNDRSASKLFVEY